MNPIYFAKQGEKGLTSTSVGHLCSIATQLKEQYMSTLNNINLVDTFVEIVGTEGTPKQISVGVTDFEKVNNSLKRICELDSFLAWFGEARKELEDAKKKLRNIDREDWFESNGIEIPDYKPRPTEPAEVSWEDLALNSLSVKDRQTYLELEAKASVYGKFIHKGQPMHVAKNEYFDSISKPNKVTGSGRDTLIYTYKPSISEDELNLELNKLQDEYRKIEQNLNHMKSDLSKKAFETNVQNQNEYEKELQDYENSVKERNLVLEKKTREYTAWKDKEAQKLKEVKFIIPDKLMNIYTELNSLNSLIKDK